MKQSAPLGEGGSSRSYSLRHGARPSRMLFWLLSSNSDFKARKLTSTPKPLVPPFHKRGAFFSGVKISTSITRLDQSFMSLLHTPKTRLAIFFYIFLPFHPVSQFKKRGIFSLQENLDVNQGGLQLGIYCI